MIQKGLLIPLTIKLVNVTALSVIFSFTTLWQWRQASVNGTLQIKAEMSSVKKQVSSVCSIEKKVLL